MGTEPVEAAPVFSVSGLSFRYERRPALECERLVVMRGEALAFVGPNGSGKTTLLKVLNGLLGPYEGRVEFLGLPLTRNPQLRLRSVYVHQHPILFAGSVRQNLAYALRLRRARADEIEAGVERAARAFKLGPLLDREAAKLSGGETQRVALARAIAAGADVLLLDEPSSSLDADGGVELTRLLIALKESGSTILFSAHDRSLVEALADRTATIEAGRVSPAV